MKSIILKPINKLRGNFFRYRQKRRWRKLRERGMHIGRGVNLPYSTWIDVAHCHLISIGDNCGFGEQCAILAHDAMPNEYIDATKIGRIIIHESCHFGMRTVIAPGVSIGPRSIVGSNAVVIRDIPPGTVAAGNPAKVICSLEEYMAKNREWMKVVPLFNYKEYGTRFLNKQKKKEMNEKLEKTFGYITGGYTAMIEEGASLHRT